MKARNIRPYATTEDIFYHISSEDIFKKYLGLPELPKKPISSPFRDDKHPSFGFFWSDNRNMWMYKDFATGSSGDAIWLVKQLYSLTYLSAVTRIATDFNLDQFEIGGVAPTVHRPLIKRKKEKIPVKKETDIKFTVRKWSEDDAKFWRPYGLTRHMLEYCGVFPISHYFINGRASHADKHAYVYLEKKDGKDTFKIYQPYNKHDRKWISNNNGSVWELWRQLPEKGDVLIIGASRKDSMVIKSLFKTSKLTSCSLQAEGVKPKGSVIGELYGRFKRIYSLYDSDEAGIKHAQYLFDAFGITPLDLKQFAHRGKDVADLRKVFSAIRLRDEIILEIKSNPIREQKPF